LPSNATDAFTLKLIALSSFVNAITGTCARLKDGNTADANATARIHFIDFIGYILLFAFIAYEILLVQYSSRLLALSSRAWPVLM
jgi:hypothetical protein